MSGSSLGEKRGQDSSKLMNETETDREAGKLVGDDKVVPSLSPSFSDCGYDSAVLIVYFFFRL